MTSEEIKDSTTMCDILQRYGLPQPNRRGFIPCPFHGDDRHPSMKIYDQDYHCFACGENGDIFSFVQRMEDIPFKEAFLSLGGTYPEREEPSFSRRLRAYRRQKRKETIQHRKEQEQLEKQQLIRQSNDLWWCLRLYPPLSDPWCDAYNAWQKVVYRLEYLNEKR